MDWNEYFWVYSGPERRIGDKPILSSQTSIRESEFPQWLRDLVAAASKMAVEDDKTKRTASKPAWLDALVRAADNLDKPNKKQSTVSAAKAFGMTEAEYRKAMQESARRQEEANEDRLDSIRTYNTFMASLTPEERRHWSRRCVRGIARADAPDC